MQEVRVHTERRSATKGGSSPDERRQYCWSVEQCDRQVRERCHAYIVRENCWDFWVLKGARYKSCCKRLDDCRECPIVQRKFSGTIPVYVRVPPVWQARPQPLQSYRCGQLQFLRGELPQGTELQRLLQDAEQTRHDLFRCRLRGVYLDFSYVGDMCLTRRGRECVFLQR